MIITGTLGDILKLEEEHRILGIVCVEANREASITHLLDRLRPQQRIVIPSAVTVQEESREPMELPNLILYKIGGELFYQDAANTIVRSLANPDFDITQQEPLTWKLTAKTTRGGPSYVSVSMTPKTEFYLVRLNK